MLKLKLAIVQSERPTSNRSVQHILAIHRRDENAFSHSPFFQLEQTVTKLQTALGFTPDQVAALPPPLVKIRELEQENTRLQKENDELRRMLEPDHRGSHLPSDYRRHNFHDNRNCDRDFKKRKMDDLYMVRTPFILSHSLSDNAPYIAARRPAW
jgi:regulator of replication initiation timing